MVFVSFLVNVAFWPQSLSSLHFGTEYNAESYRGWIPTEASRFSRGKGKMNWSIATRLVFSVTVVSCDYHVMVPPAYPISHDCHVIFLYSMWLSCNIWPHAHPISHSHSIPYDSFPVLFLSFRISWRDVWPTRRRWDPTSWCFVKTLTWNPRSCLAEGLLPPHTDLPIIIA